MRLQCMKLHKRVVECHCWVSLSYVYGIIVSFFIYRRREQSFGLIQLPCLFPPNQLSQINKRSFHAHWPFLNSVLQYQGPPLDGPTVPLLQGVSLQWAGVWWVGLTWCTPPAIVRASAGKCWSPLGSPESEPHLNCSFCRKQEKEKCQRKVKKKTTKQAFQR